MKNKKEFEDLFSDPQKFAEATIGYLRATVPDPKNPTKRIYVTHPEVYDQDKDEQSDKD